MRAKHLRIAKIWLSGVLTLGAFATSWGETEKAIFEKCDRNGDGHLDDKEFYIYSLHTGKAAAYWEAVDPMYNGKVDSKARAKMEDESRAAAQTQVDRDTTGAAARDKTRVSELYSSGEPSKINLREQLGGFQIVRTYEQLTLDPNIMADTAKANEAFKKAQPAIFSYKRDLITDENTWQVSGVIAYPLKLTPNFWIAPSVAVERLDTADPKAEKDSLIFRLQSERTIPNFLLTRSTTFRANVLFNTDSEFRKEIVGGQLDIQPATGLPGNERSYLLGNLLLNWHAFLHFEGGADVSSDNAGGGEDFARLGPKANLTAYVMLNPADLHAEINNRVQLAVDYNYFASLNHAPDEWLLRAQVITYLDKDHHLSLNAEYSKGYAPLTNTKSEAFLLTLGVKF
jgi:hypothetical protein